MPRGKKYPTKNIDPSEMTLTFPIGLIGSSTGLKTTVDLSQCASMVNRRFYRQGLNWAVAGFTLHAQSPASGSVSITRLPQTWVVSGAWEKTMRTWLRQQNEAITDAGMESAVARFRDFKIHMDKTHVDSGFSNNFIPSFKDYAGLWQYYTPGEWLNSLVVVPNESGAPGNTQEFSLHMVGDNDPAPAQSKAMIKAYAESRSTPFSPDPVNIPGAEQGLFVQMFDKGSDQEEVVDNAIDRNDNLPYPQLDYPGSATNANGLVFHDNLTITGTTVSGKTSCGGATFPCGLIRLDIDQGLQALDVGGEVRPTSWIQIHLVPGNHRGYLAESMVEM